MCWPPSWKIDPNWRKQTDSTDRLKDNRTILLLLMLFSTASWFVFSKLWMTLTIAMMMTMMMGTGHRSWDSITGWPAGGSSCCQPGWDLLLLLIFLLLLLLLLLLIFILLPLLLLLLLLLLLFLFFLVLLPSILFSLSLCPSFPLPAFGCNKRRTDFTSLLYNSKGGP